jgi:hypothetical protein
MDRNYNSRIIQPILLFNDAVNRIMLHFFWKLYNFPRFLALKMQLRLTIECFVIVCLHKFFMPRVITLIFIANKPKISPALSSQPKCLEKKCPSATSVHHKSYMELSGIESEGPQREVRGLSHACVLF